MRDSPECSEVQVFSCSASCSHDSSFLATPMLQVSTPLANERTASASTGARLGCGASTPLGPAMAAPGLKPMAQRFCQQTHLPP